jgi:signal transduction histidine kinase
MLCVKGWRHWTVLTDDGRRPDVIDATPETYEFLEQRVAARTRELEALLDVSHNVASTLELQPLLRLILDQLKSVVDYSASAIHALEERSYSVLEYRGPLPREQVIGHRVPAEVVEIIEESVRRRGAVLIADLGKRPTPMSRALAAEGVLLPRAAVNHGRAYLCVPLIVKGTVKGSVNLIHPTPGYYTEHHAALAGAFANHAAVAIENAGLYARAQGLAAMEERQRLARDLHDSVAQTLYALTLCSEAAARLVDSGELATASSSLRDVRDGAQMALEEMRLLIFDLRPVDLVRDGLVGALRARVTSVEGRAPGLQVSFTADADLGFAAVVEDALYRIAQEALNNVLRHARAHRVDVSLCRVGKTAVLEIVDDGLGFDSTGSECQHGFGLQSMIDRAAQIEARLSVQSASGEGTHVRVELVLEP